MENIKFIEAEANYTKHTGKRVNHQLHKRLFPNCADGTRRNHISELRAGKRKRYSLEMIKIICEECFVDANFLFGLEKNKQR